jgi:type II secretory pathway pseudopilin PulG
MNKKAFTLIEAMAVIALVLVMTKVTLVIMDGKARGKQEVQSAARILESDIRTAQNNALNGAQSGGASVCGYGVSVATGNGTITKYHLVKNAGICDLSDTSATGPYSVSDGTDTVKQVSVSSFPAVAGNPYVFFSIPFGGISDNSSGVAASFQFRSTRSGASTIIFEVCSYENRITDGVGTAGSTICT